MSDEKPPRPGTMMLDESIAYGLTGNMQSASEEKPDREMWIAHVGHIGYVISAGGRLVCRPPGPIGELPGYYRVEVWRADAALIADAPAMLELLRAFTPLVSEIADAAAVDNGPAIALRAAVASARAILAKHERSK